MRELSDREELEISKKVDRICDSFEKEWKSGEQPSVEDFLADTERPMRTLLLEELEKVDQDYRSQVLPTKIGRFEVRRLLGEGGHGRVYLAIDPELNRKVAIKLPRFGILADQKSFLVEAKKLVSLDHPNIVPVYEAGTTEDGMPFVVSKYIDGNDLSIHLKMGPINQDETLRAIQNISKAVDYIHRQKIIHRDIKPGNILLDQEGKPFLADFGIAKDLDASVTIDGKIQGTLAYMSPEQAEGNSEKIDERSDVYSLGVTLYEVLTGKPIFKGPMYSLLNQIKNKLPVEPRKINPTIPRNLEAVCLKAIEKEPEKRYPTALEFADDLKRAIDEKPVIARRPGIAEKTVRFVKTHPGILSSMSISLTGILALGYAAFLFFGMNGTGSGTGTETVEQLMTVTFTTNTPARLAIVPLDPNTGQPIKDQIIRPDGLTPQTVDLEPGLYWIEAVTKNGFHEVFRTIPQSYDEAAGIYKHLSWTVKDDGSIELPEIVIRKTAEMTKGMTEKIGGTATYGSPTMYAEVKPFWIAKREVTIGEYRKSGLPVSHFFHSVRRADDPNSSMNSANWDESVAYAESVGMRLPTIFEFFYADLEHYVAEWSMSWAEPRRDDWEKLPDSLRDTYPVARCFAGKDYKSLSNIGVRDHEWKNRSPHSDVKTTRHIGLGFRCSRSLVPRFIE